MHRRPLLSPACMAGAALCVIALVATACSSSGAPSAVSSTIAAAAAASTAAPATVPPTTAPLTSVAPPTAPPETVPPATAPPETRPATSAAPPVTTVPTVATPRSTPYGMPVADATRAGYAHDHHDYPASDIFVGCRAVIVSPVNGKVLEARRTDGWSQSVDNPATRGGKSVAILGDDGVRYYFAHFDSIDAGIEPGARVGVGDHLGLMGRTGRAGACHLHFAISPPCPGKEWSVRRGVIWPWRYLDAWRAGRQLSPAAEIASWSAAHPSACADAMADPHAADS